MAIDPLLYRKMSGRSGDPHSRMGEALAKEEKAKSQREDARKWLWYGFRTNFLPEFIVQVLLWYKSRKRERGD